MWSRKELKEAAKERLKGKYWNYLGVSLIPMLIMQVASVPIAIIYGIMIVFGSMNIIAQAEDLISTAGCSGVALSAAINSFEYNYEISDPMVFIKMFLPAVIFMFLAMMALAVLVEFPLSVGLCRWFVRSRETDKVKVSLCFSPFKKSNYGKTVISMLYHKVWVFIWSLLLVVPGIIKAYAYLMVPYILADNPEIGARRALKLSVAMTKGHKMRVFILELSFWGWLLLGSLVCGIGMYAVLPYIHATYAELYDKLKKEAVEKGLCTMEELGYVREDSSSATYETIPSVV